MNYERMLEGIHALYATAGVNVPVSESGVPMPRHSLRHTFGTECAARGVPVPVLKELMGHASIATTIAVRDGHERAAGGSHPAGVWATGLPKRTTRSQAFRLIRVSGGWQDRDLGRHSGIE